MYVTSRGVGDRFADGVYERLAEKRFHDERDAWQDRNRVEALDDQDHRPGKSQELFDSYTPIGDGMIVDNHTSGFRRCPGGERGRNI